MHTLDTSNSPIETHFEQVHAIIHLHRSRALQVVNNESLLICWNVGQYVSQKLEESQWGNKVVTQLSEFLRTKDPSLKGYSRRNIYNMVSFFETYSSPQFIHLLKTFKEQNEFVQNETPQIENVDNEIDPIVQNLSAQLDQSKKMAKLLLGINWSMHVEIMNNCKQIEQNVFYIIYAQKERLNYRELQRSIKTNTFVHILKQESNLSQGMQTAYPQSNYLFRDVAYLDFLGLPQKHSEKRLQNGILANMKDFILELGKDFLFIGQEYPIQVGGKSFKIDLLFFHRALQCLVAIELKATEFEPAFMGQLEFYLEALDNDVKRSNENPSIGILLCKETNREIVRYALNRSLSPTMIAKYERELIPKEVFQKSLNEFFNFVKK
ncbi:MAG: PDDEXK nuclease domain-containing protein [Saprospiraceae bacterium]